MAPSRKRKSEEMAEPTTPEASGTPPPKKLRITQTQKQALIDNLQLEITQRARQLRAHYALQCADLRSRIERRVNRIPVSMRTMTMGELIAKNNPPVELPAKQIVVVKTHTTAPAVSRQTRKRKSSIVIAADPVQEPSNDIEHETVAVSKQATLPKARAAKRPGSRTGKTGGVLSPRSHNSRTLPRSPIKATTTTQNSNSTIVECRPASPTKPTQIVRPLSPLKPASPLKSAAMATTSAITSSMHNIFSSKSTNTRGKASTKSQLTTAQRTVSQASTHSVASNTTTTSTGTVVKGDGPITTTKSVRGRAAATKKSAKDSTATTAAAVEKPAPVTKSKTGTVRRGAAAMKKAVAATATATAIATAEPATTGRRILRKRN